MHKTYLYIGLHTFCALSLLLYGNKLCCSLCEYKRLHLYIFHACPNCCFNTTISCELFFLFAICLTVTPLRAAHVHFHYSSTPSVCPDFLTTHLVGELLSISKALAKSEHFHQLIKIIQIIYVVDWC